MINKALNYKQRKKTEMEVYQETAGLTLLLKVTMNVSKIQAAGIKYLRNVKGFALFRKRIKRRYTDEDERKNRWRQKQMVNH
jgi:hypothetical protein